MSFFGVLLLLFFAYLGYKLFQKDSPPTEKQPDSTDILRKKFRSLLRDKQAVEERIKPHNSGIFAALLCLHFSPNDNVISINELFSYVQHLFHEDYLIRVLLTSQAQGYLHFDTETIYWGNIDYDSLLHQFYS